MTAFISSLVIVFSATSLSFAGATDREKMLLRFVVQKDFVDERARICGSHKDIADLVRSLTFSDAIVKLPKLDNSLKRKAVVLSLGIRGFGGYDVAKATEALRKTLETEKDLWVRLEIARVLSSLNNDAGKNVLIQALHGKDGYQTSSCMEVGKAAIPLLLLDYGFPLGFPKTMPNYAWGGLQEYFGEIRESKPNKERGGPFKHSATPETLSDGEKKWVDFIRSCKVSSRQDAMTRVLRFADDKPSYMADARGLLRVVALEKAGRPIGSFA